MTAHDTTYLGALIEQQRRLNDLSYSQMVQRAADRGEHLSKSNIGRVATGTNPALTRATIFGLAAGLGVTPATVARAALADMGIILTEPEADSEVAIRTDPTLAEHGRRLLLALLSQIRADTNSDEPAVGPLVTSRGSVTARSSDGQHADIAEHMARRRRVRESQSPSPDR